MEVYYHQWSLEPSNGSILSPVVFGAFKWKFIITSGLWSLPMGVYYHRGLWSLQMGAKSRKHLDSLLAECLIEYMCINVTRILNRKGATKLLKIFKEL